MHDTNADINVVIADDHEIFRDGLKLTLNRAPNIHLIAEAEDGQQLVDLVREHKPHVVITDIKMPKMDGIEAARKITSQWPQIGVIGLSMFDEEELVIEMLEAGAKGYLVKNADKEELIDAVKTVYLGDRYYCKQTSLRMAQKIARIKQDNIMLKRKTDFTELEIEVIKLVCEEFTNKEIAEKLNFSIRTIEGHRMKIQDKMKVKNTVGLVVYAIQNELYDPKKPLLS